MQLTPGTKLDHERYEISSHLGGSGFGQTYLAKALRLASKPTRVIKQIKPQASDQQTFDEAKKLFDEQVTVLEDLGQHPQIPNLFEQFVENQAFYLVQEFIEGEELSKEVTPNKLFSEAEVIALLREILEVLAFVHQKGVIHCHLKPSNIIRRETDKKIVLIDFGGVKKISTLCLNSQGKPNFNPAVGADGYMPSEQAQGNPDFCSDIYAVGMICIEAITRVPANKIDENPITHEVRWRDLAPNINGQLADILDKMVCRFPEHRYKSVEEVLEALKKLKNPLYKARQSRKKKSIFGIMGRDPVNRLNQIFGILAALFVVLGIPGLINIFHWNSPAENFKSYNSPNGEISIKYPKEWTEDPKSDPGTIVTFMSRKENNADKFLENLNIKVADLSTQPMTLTELTELNINQISESYSVTSDPIILVNNLPAYKAVYSGKEGSNNVTWLVVWTIKENKAYTMTFEVEADKYQEFQKTADDMIKSWQIK
ncbi:serine/threonine-protein kinase [Aerosakkonema funiforme]|uniref:non-specific serine/threonine protein kinase n=1 Tax=Aerosakkonema funiforme FACHB-1375 TaxID=2949571 RepID=A0A926ZIE4_9CYAN|nr:serine/threonine-protein kinase [Aerosakkonema funiforme]MBD2183609.1 serine/threonine protein kinase [Aerosakkonema funiforme FACHB-1375]